MTRLHRPIAAAGPETLRLDRRRFLAGASASALLAATHGPVAGAAVPGPGSSPRTRGEAPQRILGLRLLTATPLAEMKDFYHRALGLPVLSERSGELTVGAGATRLTFVTAEPAAGRPFYHVAFNVPENKILAARGWQLQRTRLIPPDSNLRDPDYPPDVVAFRHWNAHSLFFWDPAGNLLEHIARHDLDNGAPGPFTTGDILYASEIAFVVDDVPAATSQMKEALGLPQYWPSSRAFAALGDEHGLLLVFRRGRMLGFGEARPADVFATTASIRGAEPASYRVPSFPYHISAG